MPASKDSKRKQWHRVISPQKPQVKAFQCTAAVCEELVKNGSRKQLDPGTIIFHKGDKPKGVYLVLSGRVALSAGDDPTRITRVAGERSLLGLPATVRNRAYSLTAETVTPVEVCVISPNRFRELLREDTSLGTTVIAILAEEISVLRKLAVYKLR